jgi:hypothetical protein
MFDGHVQLRTSTLPSRLTPHAKANQAERLTRRSTCSAVDKMFCVTGSSMALYRIDTVVSLVERAEVTEQED